MLLAKQDSLSWAKFLALKSSNRAYMGKYLWFDTVIARTLMMEIRNRG